MTATCPTQSPAWQAARRLARHLERHPWLIEVQLLRSRCESLNRDQYALVVHARGYQRRPEVPPTWEGYVVRLRTHIAEHGMESNSIPT